MAKKFYGIITFSTLAGVAMNFMPIDPIKALYWSAVLNGVMAVPIMVVMMMLVSRKDVMGDHCRDGRGSARHVRDNGQLILARRHRGSQALLR